MGNASAPSTGIGSMLGTWDFPNKGSLYNLDHRAFSTKNIK